MQIGTVTNQYINNYHNTAAVQTYNDQQVRQVQDMSETTKMVSIYIDDAVFRKRKYVVTIEPDAYS